MSIVPSSQESAANNFLCCYVALSSSMGQTIKNNNIMLPHTLTLSKNSSSIYTIIFSVIVWQHLLLLLSTAPPWILGCGHDKIFQYVLQYRTFIQSESIYSLITKNFSKSVGLPWAIFSLLQYDIKMYNQSFS